MLKFISSLVAGRVPRRFCARTSTRRSCGRTSRRVQEQEQRLPDSAFDDLVQDAVDFIAVGMRPHTMARYCCSTSSSRAYDVGCASEKKHSRVRFDLCRSEATCRAISPRGRPAPIVR
ncbi:hypothetical protein GTV15_19370 [Streptomyces sp. SID7803]|nr:hypothetical protein [Streptomyces sp. SID7803]